MRRTPDNTLCYCQVFSFAFTTECIIYRLKNLPLVSLREKSTKLCIYRRKAFIPKTVFAFYNLGGKLSQSSI